MYFLSISLMFFKCIYFIIFKSLLILVGEKIFNLSLVTAVIWDWREKMIKFYRTFFSPTSDEFKKEPKRQIFLWNEYQCYLAGTVPFPRPANYQKVNSLQQLHLYWKGRTQKYTVWINKYSNINNIISNATGSNTFYYLVLCCKSMLIF